MYRKRLQERKKSRTVTLLLITTIALGTLTTGCSQSGPPPTATPIVTKPATTIASKATVTKPQERTEPEYAYSAIGRRDPFASIVEKGKTAEPITNRPPLERYNLFDFKVTGVVWGGFGYNAMVEAPDGKGYFIHVGSVIGLNKGVVKKITQDKVIVEEKFKNFSGETERREYVVELRKKQEGMQ